ncbi:hypothetical protein G9A89_012637 [Geosiphon pyriformis]|nr:hypothetical protein G9A89_012637 [Geosiphon pyriformis]
MSDLSSKCPLWLTLLQKSLKNNSQDPVYVQMTNLRRTGQPSLHNIRFQDFLKDDPRYLLFLMAFNDGYLHGDVKASPQAQLCWQMPSTKEIYNISGRFYISAAPLKITRFPPPKILPDNLSYLLASEYWESIRRLTWESISSQTRASFTLPPSGVPKLNQNTFVCQRLEHMLNSNVKIDHPERILHDMAFENMCILVFKISEVVRFEYEMFPPKRFVYTFNEEENDWTSRETNP